MRIDRQRLLRLERQRFGTLVKVYDWMSEGREGADVQVHTAWIFWFRGRPYIYEKTQEVYCA